MKPEGKKEVVTQVEGFLNSYAQVFFSVNPAFAIMLLALTFIDVYAGATGVLSVLTANLAARSLGLNGWSIRKGYYGFNSLLVGLGFGISFEPGLTFFLLAIAAALLTVFFSAAIQGFLYKYGLPFLSLPFLLGFWIISLASGEFSALGLSLRGIYTHNELYALGGKWLIDTVFWFDNLFTHPGIRAYLLSLGAIFFQYNLLAGTIIALGLLISSRIAFTLSIIGFVLAWGFYHLTGADIHQLSYSYIGFNYILTSLALGGFFIIPSRWSYLWLIWLLPLVIITTVSLHKLFALLQLGVYALPFNLIVLTFLYVLKLREGQGTRLTITQVQLFSPERNLYHKQITASRFHSPLYLPVSLPVMGEWVVSQGWKGTHTHKGEWAQAIDLVMKGNDGKEYRGTGDNLQDYHCYGKPVIAPADGTIANLADGIPDNQVGEDNTRFNWGNSIVIRHSEHLHSQVSHLKPGSLRVSKGDPVKKGDVLGLCGNSGRSPYPHLHFQFQETPHIGSKTLHYPLSEYLLHSGDKPALKTHSVPSEGERITAIQNHPLLEKAFQFLPGRTIRFEVRGNGPGWLKGIHDWEIKADEYNNNYVECSRTGATAWFYNNGNIHYFTNFSGSRKSLLYYFYLAFYKVLTGFYQGITVKDQLPPDRVFRGLPLFVQDFFSPFTIFLKAEYQMEYQAMSDDFYASTATLKATIKRKWQSDLQFDITLSGRCISEFTCHVDDFEFTAICTDT